ncbi:MFS transporter [Neobacillus kokaensis]|uniref:Multidrug efflux MFS transporter NorA n=1 Tax=Neobacillus kokaensis TaxID=2759023 RepID=A0ABQ3N674_9BACI|nr:MFS transporter [Neobacillus kokaensis]GHH99546.1 multidrug efflux MFS transporter NorA [Neobacillus kokaensis]
MLQTLSLSPGVKRFLATESLYGLSIGMFTFILNLHLYELGISEKQIGFITSSGILVKGILAITVGILAKKIGRKKLLVTGIGSVALGCMVFAVSESFMLFFLAQIIVSIGFTLVETTEIQLLFYYSHSKREETQAYSFMFAVFTAFTGVGMLLAGYLPKLFDSSGRGYQNTLLVTSIVFILLVCARALLLPTEQREETAPIQRNVEKNISAVMKKPSRDLWKKLLLFSVFAFLTGGAVSCLQPYLNLIVKFRFDFSNEAVSILLALNGFALFIGSVFSPFLIEKLGMNKTFFYIYLVNIIFCFILFLNIPAYFFSALLVMRGGSFTMLTNLTDSLSMSSFKDEERDLYAGMSVVFRSIGSALVAFGIGGIIAEKNYTLPFLLTGLFLLAGYFYFLRVIIPKYFKTNRDVYSDGQKQITNEV